MCPSTIGAVASDSARKFLQLHLIPDVGPIRTKNLLAHFGSIHTVLQASRAELQRVDQIGPRTAEAICRLRGDEAVAKELELATHHGVRVLCPDDAEFPKLLLRIDDPPVCIYVRGELQPTDAVAIAIVGTRRCSFYGQEQAARFGETLGRAGFTVVSGLARGVDGLAHRGALRAGGRTIAVLGNGLCSIYPPEHASLADEVCAAGAVISESPMETLPDPGNFPRRNRLIAGLTLGTLVIEAGMKSGALITARCAAEYNREVFAIPGRIDRPDLSAGVNALIRDGGAKLVTCLEDILDELKEVGDIMRRPSNTDAPATSAVAPTNSAHASAPIEANAANLTRDHQMSDAQRSIVSSVQRGAEDIETICSTTGLDSSVVIAQLTDLQLRGYVRRLPGDRFECRRSK